jgi:Anthranilate synthase component I, N terminal region
VGYLGYDLKDDLGSPGRHAVPMPDACLLYAPRLLVLDHRKEEAFAVSVLGPSDHEAKAKTGPNKCASSWPHSLMSRVLVLRSSPKPDRLSLRSIVRPTWRRSPPRSEASAQGIPTRSV